MNISEHRGNLKTLVADVDSPFFYYDLDFLSKHIKNLKQLPVKLWYALKANPLSRIIDVINENGINFDVASIGELEQVLSRGVNPQNILHTGPAKSYAQLEYFLAKGVRTFVIESINQLSDLSVLVESNNIQVEVLLRVQLVWDNQEKNVLGGGGAITPFGLTIADWQEYFATELKLSQNLNIIGMHCFQWGNILCPNKLKNIWQTITKSLLELADSININLKVIDLGGGIGIPYTAEQRAVLVEQIIECFNDFKKDFPNIEYWLELGRYAVGECGVYVTKIIDKKTVNNTNLLITDGGAHHLIRPALTAESFPATALNESKGNFAKYQIHGPLCTSLDRLGVFYLPSDVAVNEYIVFSQAGAYGFTESMPFFLCHNLPAEVVYKDNTTTVVRKAKKPDTWLV